MGFLGAITPTEMEAGRVLSLVTMAGVIGLGLVPPLRPYAHRIRVVTSVGYIGCVLGFIAYCALFR